MALADNVDGGDDLDLIVTTMNGNVFCFSTPSPHHPLKVEKCVCIAVLVWPHRGCLHRVHHRSFCEPLATYA
jgi:hypothetical protein